MGSGVARLCGICVLALLTAAPAQARIRWLTFLDELSGPGKFDGRIFSAELWCIGTMDDDSKALVDALESQIELLRSMLPRSVNREPASLAADRPSALPDNNQINAQIDALRKAEVKAKGLVRAKRCYANRQNAALAILVEAGFWKDKHHDPTHYTGETGLNSFEFIGYFPLHRVVGQLADPNRFTRATELGIGLGAYKLTGNTVRESEWWRGSVPLRARFILGEFFYKNTATGDSKDPPRTRFARRLSQIPQFHLGWDYLPNRIIYDESFKSTTGLTGRSANRFKWTYAVQFDLGSVAWALLDATTHSKPKNQMGKIPANR